MSISAPIAPQKTSGELGRSRCHWPWPKRSNRAADTVDTENRVMETVKTVCRLGRAQPCHVISAVTTKSRVFEPVTLSSGANVLLMTSIIMKRACCAWPSTDEEPFTSNLRGGKRSSYFGSSIATGSFLQRQPMFSKAGTLQQHAHCCSSSLQIFDLPVVVAQASLVRCEHGECYQRAAQNVVEEHKSCVTKRIASLTKKML